MSDALVEKLIAKESEISLVDHNDLIAKAAYVNPENPAYFVMHCAQKDNSAGFFGIICETYVDKNYEPLKFRVVLQHRTHTLARAIRLVEDQYRIDAYDED